MDVIKKQGDKTMIILKITAIAAILVMTLGVCVLSGKGLLSEQNA